MMKLKANPRDTSPLKHTSHPQQQLQQRLQQVHRVAVNDSPLLKLHEETNNMDNSSFADGIDSTATGLHDASMMSGMTETIDSYEEKKINDDDCAAATAANRHNISYDDILREPEPTVKMTIAGVDNYFQHNIRQYKVKTHIVAPPRAEQQSTPALGNDPWSSEPWNDTFWSTSSTQQKQQQQKHQQQAKQSPNTTVDASFDTLQFQPRINHRLVDPFDVGFGILQDTSLNNTTMTSATTVTTSTEGSPRAVGPSRSRLVTIRVVVQERLSILFDDTVKDPICRVVGRIFVQPPASIMKHHHIDSFCLTIRDKKSNIEQWDESNTRCQNVTATVPHLALHPRDQVFKVSTTENLQSPVVGYTCIPRLRPMPMLLKTKVHRKDNRCRVGIRIRANPQNGYVLNDVAILVIVPLDMDGSSLTMSRKDGVWDSMKRSLTWTVPELPPGDIVDIQAQFKAVEGVLPSMAENDASSKFPVLARSSGSTTFSRIDLNSDFTQDGAVPIDIDVQRSSTVLYRKV